MKSFLKRIPGAVTAYRHTVFLYRVARERLCNRGRMNDVSHLRRDWDFEASGEQQRHELVLAAVAGQYPHMSQANVLELGCSDGVFTARLAQCCASVTACDISAVALELARRRCQRLGNVSFQELDFAREALPGRYDIIFAMDVLEFIHGKRHLQGVVDRLAGALGTRGLMAVSSCRLPLDLRDAWWMGWFPEGADAIVQQIAASPCLRMVHSEVHPSDESRIDRYVDHVIAVFCKMAEY